MTSNIGEETALVTKGPNGIENGPHESSTERRNAVVVIPDADVESDEDEKDEPSSIEDIIEHDVLAELPDDTEEIELVHSRLRSLDHLNLKRFAGHLKKLCLRQNFITTLDPDTFSVLLELTELDLYDNKIKNIGPCLEALPHLGVLDLSFNLLKSVPETVDRLRSLHTVYFVQNRISKINNLGGVGATLRSLELGGNRIRKIENLDALVNLEELWLGKNKITKLEGLESLTRLTILSIQSNRITKLECLEKLGSLEELYISHNGIEKLDGLQNNTKLRVLDVGNNFIKKIENISHLSNLEEFWASSNLIPNLADLSSQLAPLPSLETVYLEGNPAQKEDVTGYRRKVMLALPQLKQIDATFVRL